MVLGLSIQNFTLLHVAISLIAIASGFVVVFAMLRANPSPGWTALFLITTVLTTVTGFLFPITVFTPALGTGILSSVILLIALFALYGKKLGGAWRWIYVVTAVFAFYLNVFVLVVQAFQKVGALNALAPNGSEPPFLIAQAVVLVAFVIVGALAVMWFRPLLARAALT
jgi:hypothetical protein